MQTIEIYGDGIGRVDLVDHMGTDLTVVNAARVSYGKHKDVFDDGDRKLIHYLMKNRHTSPLEQVSTTFRFVCPLFVRSQHHRHRTWCLSGDTVITFNRPDRWKSGIHVPQSPWSEGGFTLKSLHEKWTKNSWTRSVVQRQLVRVYNEDTKKFTVSHIANVIYSGKKEVFKVTLEDGYEVKSTKDHRFLTTNGWMTLEEAVGLKIDGDQTSTTKECFILTNGSETPYKDKNWLENARKRGLSVQEIADEAGCSYMTIRKWLKIYGLQFDPIKNMLEHNRKNGVWNKGKRGYKLGERELTQEHLANIRKARSGEASNWWNGGVSSERSKIARWTRYQAKKIHKKNNYTCTHCNTYFSENYGRKLHAHHIESVIDRPDLAYDINNLTTVCVKCHYKWHTRKGGELTRSTQGTPLKALPKKVLKVEYVGVEDTYDLTIEGDHHNFVGNGIVLHNCYSEISRRYTSDDIAFYYPQQWRRQSKNNKQASEEPFDAPHIDQKVKDYCLRGYNLYLELQEQDEVAREMARMILPQNLYTQYYGTVNLHNALHFLSLRLHPHAQWEIQRVAWAMKEILKGLYPEIMNVWEELNGNAATPIHS